MTTNLHAMQRANGDWFAFDSHGRTTVPLFKNHREAMAIRSQNLELLLFKPVRLDPVTVKSLLPDSGTACDFLLVETESLNMKQGLLIDEAQLRSRVGFKKG